MRNLKQGQLRDLLCEMIKEKQAELAHCIDIQELEEKYNDKYNEFLLEWFSHNVEKGEHFVHNHKIDIYFCGIKDGYIIFELKNHNYATFVPYELMGELSQNGVLYV